MMEPNCPSICNYPLSDLKWDAIGDCIIFPVTWGGKCKNVIVTVVTQKPDGSIIGAPALMMTDENGVARARFPVDFVPCLVIGYVYFEEHGQTYEGFAFVNLNDETNVPKLVQKIIFLKVIPERTSLAMIKLESIGAAILNDKQRMELT
ncbi:hypothetical protein [Gabonibacter chumensis]|uniref:hypothetical protein n=1 Tax=Gabonibacter chumensis TaxID=2972474 RepID=UPI00257305E8|nr:hypothetical protein [Gabonibacter chumensis]MCR9011505.1 hypothetical protein [Gabonibacter chumensis]